MNKGFIFAVSLFLTTLMACQPTPNNKHVKVTGPVMYNQLGYPVTANKQVFLQSDGPVHFKVADKSGELVLTGVSTKPKHWPFAAQDYVMLDLKQLHCPGVYKLFIPDSGLSPVIININDQVYQQALTQVTKAFYFNRAGTALKSEHAGIYARAAGHTGKTAIIHASAADAMRPAGTQVEIGKGWYDAGDYNQYVVNGSVALASLLLAYQDFPIMKQLSLNIPKSEHHQTDMLDEILWQLDWLSKMQDPNDGGVYHKLTTKKFTGKVMPDEALSERYLVAKSVTASLDFSAVMALASRVLVKVLPVHANEYLAAAKKAYIWALKHPKQVYQQPADIHTGEYASRIEQLNDEWFWATSELAIVTEQADLWQKIPTNIEIQVASWSQVAAFAYFALAKQETNLKWQQQAQRLIVQLADELVKTYQNSSLAVTMGHHKNDFIWGSNGTAANQLMILAKAYQISQKAEYKLAMQGTLDYLMGKNPTGYLFITGMGTYSPVDIHHRISAADKVKAPVPGWLVGGPHAGQQDKCNGYPSELPALSYLDTWCSYSTNEVAINWNAALVYALAAFNEQKNEREKE
ncbi:glycoside hydrolase family 9 protein [Gayadomonas joobiniege]|uniref:glycoside hydrolase family 9 protein n=1 Tax=Gayadomonas joobiniege TaxID=1234606 RepID=UPI0003682667|nr:glycoside hydrolase family 9 protein [Gayadomonas joobiniege]